jgi:hypothetical protein
VTVGTYLISIGDESAADQEDTERFSCTPTVPSPANDALLAMIRATVLQLENTSCFGNVTLGELAEI